MTATQQTDPIPTTTPPEPTPPAQKSSKRPWFQAKRDPDLIEIRHDMAGTELPFRVVCKHPVWYRFLVWMFAIGGTAILYLLISTSYSVGKWVATPTSTTTPPAVVATVPVPTVATPPVQPTPAQPVAPPAVVTPLPVVTPTQPVVVQPQPAPPPTKIQVDANVNLKIEAVQPAQPTGPAVQKPPVLSEAERRNEALKERLRRQYDIK